MEKRRGNLDYNLESILELWRKLLDNEHVRETLEKALKDELNKIEELSEEYCTELENAIKEEDLQKIKKTLKDILKVMHSKRESFGALLGLIDRIEKKGNIEDMKTLGKVFLEALSPQTKEFNENWIEDLLNLMERYGINVQKGFYKRAQSKLGELFGRTHIKEHFILNGCSRDIIERTHKELRGKDKRPKYREYEEKFKEIREKYREALRDKLFDEEKYPLNLQIDKLFDFMYNMESPVLDLEKDAQRIKSIELSPDGKELRIVVENLGSIYKVLGIDKKKEKEIVKTLPDGRIVISHLPKKVLVILSGKNSMKAPSGVYVIKEIRKGSDGYHVNAERVIDLLEEISSEDLRGKSKADFIATLARILSGPPQEGRRSGEKNKREEKEKERRKVRTRNIILYGPVGTGKTLIAKAFGQGGPEVKGKGKKILEEIQKLTGIQGEVQGHEFITFHKSYSYEEFIEGIRPIVNEKGEVNYVIFDGIFKKLCLRAIASAIVQANKEGTLEKETIGEERIVEIARRLQGLLEKEELGAKEYEEYLGLKRQLWNWIKEKLKEKEGRKFLEKIFENAPPYLLIIDEINRGDPSRIFGELLTLIEDNKRIGEKEAMTVTLPYSRELFGVPSNLYIIGTMNTTDRSIALLDMALRRRFTFIEVLPNEEILNGTKIGEIDLGELLKKLNEGIRKHKDMDHQLGHAFLMGVETEDDLVRAWNYKIAPFLEEVFYSDPEGLKGVLGPSLLEGEEEVKKVKRFDRDSKEDLIKALTSLVGTENKQEGQNA